MAKKTILIVEDELPVAKALEDKIKREGFMVLRAKDGQEGLEVALKRHPDLILLDILMPVMDGITMFKELRKDDWGKNVKVIVLTNLDETEKVADSIELGSYGYLVKSDWKIEEVIEKIRKVLENNGK